MFDKLKIYNSQYYLHSLADTRTIMLILGRGCNMCCPHCSQNKAKLYQGKTIVTNEFIDWVVKWARLVPKSSQVRTMKTIMFWGGEPLVYWKEIVEIVEHLNEKGITKDNFDFKVFTNGLLLTQEKLDFMYKHNFMIAMSYDSPNPLLIRSHAPSQEIIDLFNSYPGRRRVNSIYTAKTPSIVKMFETLGDLFPGAIRTMGPIRDGEGVPEELSMFPKGKIKKDFTEFYYWLVDHNWPKDLSGFFKNSYMAFELLKKYGKKEWIEYPFPYCRILLASIPMDLSGNVYLCHNGENVIGNIFKDSFNDLQDVAINIWKNNRPTDCQSCKYLGMCTNGCPEYKHTPDKKSLTQCIYFKEMFETVEELMV